METKQTFLFDLDRETAAPSPPVSAPVPREEGPRPRRESPLAKNHREALDRAFSAYETEFPKKFLHASYYPYAGLTHTVRVRREKILVRIDERFEEQPARVIEAVGHILFRKLLRRRPLKKEWRIAREAERVLENVEPKTGPGPGRIPVDPWKPTQACLPPTGKTYNLSSIQESLRGRFFGPSFPALPIFWSKAKARRYWGKYYSDFPRVVLNSRLDNPGVPLFVVEAVVYHEMLHHHLGVEVVNGRRRMHTREFREAENAFPRLAEAEEFLKEFGTRRRGRKKSLTTRVLEALAR